MDGSLAKWKSCTSATSMTRWGLPARVLNLSFTFFQFVMVFIVNPRRETNRVGGDRIILRSMHNKLHLQHTCSTLFIKIEVVEVGVVLVFIPNFFLLKGVYPPILRPLHPQ